MSQYTPTTLSASDTDPIAKLNAEHQAIATAVNSNDAQIQAAVGPGAQLILDVFDRDGLVGEQSYQLDLENYGGQNLIDIGRRPAPDALKGEVDVSTAWLTLSTGKARVQQAGDVTLDASPIITGLPKSIYVGIGASGVAQFFEDTSEPFVLYAYSMTWDGFSFTNIKRRVPILPGYGLLMAMASRPRPIQVYDPDTNWVDEGILESETEIVTLGDELDNEIGIDGAVEVLGFFVHAHNQGDDGWNAPEANPPDSLVTLRVVSEAVVWSEMDLEIDTGQVPDSVFARVNPAVGDDIYVTEVRRFRLELVSIGGSVSSARGFTWGVLTRPIYGTDVPKNPTTVEMI